MVTVNLLYEINRQDKFQGLKDLVLYGRVRCAIERPPCVGGKLETTKGFFAILDVYAIKCLGVNYFSGVGSNDSDGLYFVKGNVIIFLDNPEYISKDVKVFGNVMNRGVTVKQQFSHKSRFDGITALCFKMAGRSNFVVTPNKITELLVNDSSIRATALQDFVAKVVINKEFIEYPESLDAFEEFRGSDEYTELDVSTSIPSEGENTSVYVNDERFIDVSKLKMDLTYNLEEIEESPMLDAVKSEVNNLSSLRKKYARDLKEKYNGYREEELHDDFIPEDFGLKSGEIYYEDFKVCDTIQSSFINTIASRYDVKIPNTKVRYGVFVDNFISSLSDNGWEGIGTEDDVNKMVTSSLKEELIDEYKIDPSCLYGEGKFQGIKCLSNPIKFSALVIGELTGVGGDNVKSNFRSCHRMGIGLDLWFYCLIRNPYYLGMLGIGLSVWDIDKIYYSFGKHFSGSIHQEEVCEMRNCLLLLESMKSSMDADSLVNEYSIKRSYKYNYKSRRLIELNGFPLKKENLVAISTMLGEDVSRYVNITAMTMKNPFTPERIKDLYENKGLVEEVDLKGELCYALASNMEKELIIYTTLYEKGQTETGITKEQVDAVVEEFEEEVGFKLEKLQKDAMYLTMNKAAVLAGCAGSGKTTTSECMTKIITTALNGSYKLGYSTPTGKACRRLAEVVGGDVRTLHSRFGIGLDGSSYLGDVSVRSKVQEDKMVYFFDEMAMCSMDLLFEVCRHITKDDLVYFMGDVGQLPPIGRGNPFKLLMSILPCVELGVSKRAAEGSLVNYNCTLLNHLSDNYVVELKYDNKTFISNECNDAEIPLKTTSMFKNFMEGRYGGVRYSEDDIQVITGYQKPDIAFSSPALNTPLHSLLRKNDRVLFKYLDKDYCKNERVIHLKRNSYEMPRYTTTDMVTFKEELTFGVVNGEVGKIIGMVRSDMCTFIPLDTSREFEDFELELLKRREEREIVDNSMYKSENTYFVIVEIYDVDLKKNVVALYRANKPRNLLDMNELSLEGGDLQYLDYAYALTTHKMQGSQSKVVIAALGSSSNPEFINRNMLNTIFTRSQGVVGVVGSVKGEDSAINAGRRNKSQEYCKDVLSILVGAPI